jgi:hypothetical protein
MNRRDCISGLGKTVYTEGKQYARSLLLIPDPETGSG